jgi:hypothetical protein
MTRTELEQVVDAVLGETFSWWDGYYLPKTEKEMKEYVRQVSDVVEKVVGGTGIGPVTPCMSSKCSTAELTARTHLDDACSYFLHGDQVSPEESEKYEALMNALRSKRVAPKNEKT